MGRRSTRGGDTGVCCCSDKYRGQILCLCAESAQADGCRVSGRNFGLHSVGVIMLSELLVHVEESSNQPCLNSEQPKCRNGKIFPQVSL